MFVRQSLELTASGLKRVRVHCPNDSDPGITPPLLLWSESPK